MSISVKYEASIRYHGIMSFIVVRSETNVEYQTYMPLTVKINLRLGFTNNINNSLRFGYSKTSVGGYLRLCL